MPAHPFGWDDKMIEIQRSYYAKFAEDLEKSQQAALKKEIDNLNSAKMKRISLKTDIDVDLKFWSIIPSININLNNKSIEFEWLCLGIYVFYLKSYGE